MIYPYRLAAGLGGPSRLGCHLRCTFFATPPSPLFCSQKPETKTLPASPLSFQFPEGRVGVGIFVGEVCP